MPPAPPTTVARADEPAPRPSAVEAWAGPDNAVATWYSPTCGREVLSYGAQQYAVGSKVDRVPAEVMDLGYRSGTKELWGDRGAPTTLYATADKGKSFEEWIAVDTTC